MLVVNHAESEFPQRPKPVVRQIVAPAYGVRTATAQTSRKLLSCTKKDSFVQLPTLDSALSWLAAIARIA